jgi:HEAT repeat protein
MPAPRLALIAVLLAAPLGAARASDAQVERALRALREDGSLKVRAQAAFVLAQRGARAAVPALCKALS